MHHAGPAYISLEEKDKIPIIRFTDNGKRALHADPAHQTTTDAVFEEIRTAIRTYDVGTPLIIDLTGVHGLNTHAQGGLIDIRSPMNEVRFPRPRTVILCHVEESVRGSVKRFPGLFSLAADMAEAQRMATTGRSAA